LERTTWRAWLRPALVVAIPALAILAAIPPVRVCEIPLVSPGFDMHELARPVSSEEKETFTLYQRAIRLLQQAGDPTATPLDNAQRRKAEEQAMTLAVEASRRPLPGYCVDRDIAPRPGDLIHLGEMVLASGKRLEAEGRLDAALDRYVAAASIASQQPGPGLNGDSNLDVSVCEQVVHWAAQSGQKSRRILEALRTLEKLWARPPGYCDEIQQNYLVNRRILEGDSAAPNGICDTGDTVLYVQLMRWLPWERAHAVRLLNKLTADEIERCRKIETTLTTGCSVSADAKASPVLPKDVSSYLVTRMVGHIPLDDWLKVETCRRATRLILALEAWKSERGRLPDSLGDLSGTYLDQIPVDPYTGSEFRYEPKGLTRAVEWCSSKSTDMKTLEPGRPFVACSSWPQAGSMMPYGTVSVGPKSARLRGGVGATLSLNEVWEDVWLDLALSRAARTPPLKEVWEDVWVFPIP
jgi:hypothetical protein